MDKVHKPSDSECYTPRSEPFGFYTKFNLKNQYTSDVITVGGPQRWPVW
jgi:hypothetical protein